MTTYIRALDACYAGYKAKVARKLGVAVSTETPSQMLFHCPYCKLVSRNRPIAADHCRT